MVTFITKANDDVLSRCTCTGVIAAGPAQLDCPWCGCGWLISCMNCRKAFTFARVIDFPGSYRDIVREDFQRRGEDVTEDDITRGALWMEEAFSNLKIGDIVVWLDGAYMPLDTANFAYDGWHAQHDFDRLPHAVALEQPGALQQTLGNQAYWQERELEPEVS